MIKRICQSAKKTKLPSVLYSVEIHQRYITEKDVYSVDNALRRYREKLPEVSFFRAKSLTGKNARRKIVRRKKRGRPRIIVIGSRKPLHVHIGVLGDNACAYAQLVQKTLKKRFKEPASENKKVQLWSKGNGERAAYFIHYCHKQASSFLTGGKFNFQDYFDWPPKIKNVLLEKRQH